MPINKKDNITRINEVQRKITAGEEITIAFLGDSVTWGSDPNADRETTNVTADNGDFRDYIRTTSPMPEKVGEVLNSFLPGVVNIINLGFPGDDVLESAEHWTESRGADIFIMNFGLNDHNSFDFETFEEGYRVIIDRWFDDGAGIVLAKPTQRRYKNSSDLKVFEAVVDKLCEEIGCLALEPNLITYDFDYSFFSGVDKTHFNDKGYREYGRAMAAYFLGSGLLKKETLRSGDFVQMNSRQIDYFGASEILSGVDGAETRFLYASGIAGGIVNISSGDTLVFPIYTDVPNMLIVPQYKISDGNVECKISEFSKECNNLFDTLFHTGNRYQKNIYKFDYKDDNQIGGTGYFSLANYRRDFLKINLPILSRKGIHLIEITNNSTGDCRFSGVELIQEKVLMAWTTKAAYRGTEDPKIESDNNER